MSALLGVYLRCCYIYNDSIFCLFCVEFFFVCVDALPPTQQLFGHVGMFSCLPMLNLLDSKTCISMSYTFFFIL